MTTHQAYFIKGLLPFLLALTIFACTESTNTTNEMEKRIEQLLKQMTIEEKMGQLSQIEPSFPDNEEKVKEAVREGRYGSFLNISGVEKINELQRIAVEESRLKFRCLSVGM